MTCSFICQSIHHVAYLTDPTSSSLVFFFFFQPIGHCDWLMHVALIVPMRSEKAYAEACGKVSSRCLYNASEFYLGNVVKSVSFPLIFPSCDIMEYSNHTEIVEGEITCTFLSLT